MGLIEKDLRRVNPSLIYASIKGFGEASPWADLPGYEAVVAVKTGVFAPEPDAPVRGHD